MSTHSTTAALTTSVFFFCICFVAIFCFSHVIPSSSALAKAIEDVDAVTLHALPTHLFSHAVNDIVFKLHSVPSAAAGRTFEFVEASLDWLGCIGNDRTWGELSSESVNIDLPFSIVSASTLPGFASRGFSFKRYRKLPQISFENMSLLHLAWASADLGCVGD